MQYAIYGGASVSKEAIIALPPLGERKEVFSSLGSVLSGHRIISFDLPGHNGEVDMSLTNYLKGIHHVLNQLEISEAHFIGNSIGAWIIQKYYGTYPKEVLSLTLLDGGYYPINERPSEYIQLPIIHKNDFIPAIKEHCQQMSKLTNETSEVLFSYLKNNFILTGEEYKHHSDEKAVNRLIQQIHTDSSYYLRKCDIPLQLLIADLNLDEISKTKLTAFTKEHPNTDVYHINNGYHFLPITNTKEVAEKINQLMIVANA